MRRIVTLCILFSWTAISLQTEDATSLIQSILDVDRALAQEIKNDISQAKEKEDQLRNEFAKNLNDSVQRLKNALGERLTKLRDIEQAYKAEEYVQKQNAMNEWNNLVKGINETKAALEEEKEKEVQQEKENIRQLLDQLKLAYQKRKEERAAEKEQEKEQIRQAWQKAKEKFDQIQTKLNDSVNAKNERRKEMLENMRSTLGEIRAIISQEKAARDQQKQQRRDEYEDKINQIKSNVGALKDDLDAREEELRVKYAEFKQKQNEFKETVQKALRDGVKASVVMELGNKLQNALDKKALDTVLSENMEKQKQAMAAPKATVLDEITGVSSWRTVTWILLALCILLCVALIALIIYQNPALGSMNASREDFPHLAFVEWTIFTCKRLRSLTTHARSVRPFYLFELVEKELNMFQRKPLLNLTPY
ncbi:hypothetical protein Y032_0001g212 [Ancylostoma ceylanicum]|uniref:Uncharacterized protein n=1 Tax=Ancylostoma ceylanicum TaxID=53326 RepID=A0A016W351_9BILA|nr:hypothetical protein Y032_0001g212 [Ancylostoma ceylanicum]